MARRRTFSLLLAAITVGITSCETPTANESQSPDGIKLNIVSGDTQQAREFTQLQSPIVVQLLSSRGKPLVGQIVNFRTLLASGSVWAGSAITDSKGIAREWWTLGDYNPFEQLLEARAIDPVTGEKIVLATARAVATQWTSVQLQCQFPGQTSWTPVTDTDCPALQVRKSVPVGGTLVIKYRVLDDGTPVPGVPLEFIVSNGGKVTPPYIYTGADGTASVTFTAGTPGVLNSVDAYFVAKNEVLSVGIKVGY